MAADHHPTIFVLFRIWRDRRASSRRYFSVLISTIGVADHPLSRGLFGPLAGRWRRCCRLAVPIDLRGSPPPWADGDACDCVERVWARVAASTGRRGRLCAVVAGAALYALSRRLHVSAGRTLSAVCARAAARARRLFLFAAVALGFCRGCRLSWCRTASVGTIPLFPGLRRTARNYRPRTALLGSHYGLMFAAPARLYVTSPHERI